MNRDDGRRTIRLSGLLKVIATVMTAVLLPPFLALAFAPLLLFLVPVALVAVPCMIPAMLSGSLAARSEDRLRATWKLTRHAVGALR